MKQVFKRIGIGCLAVFFIWSCSRHTTQETLQPATTGIDIYLQQELQRISGYLDQAANPAPESDSLDIEFYYQRAMEELDQLSLTHEFHPAFLDLQSRALAAYDDYLAALNPAPTDSLSADFVLQELSELYAAEGNGNLDATVSPNTQQLKIPIVINSKVERAIQYFTRGKGRKVFQRWLERAGTYRPMVQQILREEGAPEELFYLAMIESGFNSQARSWARAVGMWQFISATGRAYGLENSWWFDDRRDPVKATRAAARHLMDLYERFGDWHLAIAGYNFSPGKIERRLRQKNVSDFWTLPRLPRETRNYVPTYLAAVTIASDPGKYGFEISNSAEPLVFDTMTVKECVDLNVVAEAIGSSFEEMKRLNPGLLRWCTPPDVERWTLYLPQGKREAFAAKYADIPKEKKMSWAHHRVRSGETLSTIGRRYGVSVSEIKRFNKIRGTLIRIGQGLVIPVPADTKVRQKYAASESAAAPRHSVRRSKPVENVAGREKHEYVVKQGDSLWEIARRYNVSLAEIRTWNGLGYSRLIKPGQSLNIWLLPGGNQSSVAAQPAAVLAQAAPPPVNDSQPARSGEITHTVASGETLWDIAQSYNVSIGDIKRWNGKRSNLIHPGDALKIMPK